VARAIRDVPFDCVSLKVGINIAIFDTFKGRTFAPAVHGFLDTIRDGHPEVPILVVSPIVCPILEDAPGPLAFGDDGLSLANPDGGGDALSLRRVRELLAEAVERRGDPHLHYLDGLLLFGQDDVDELPDGVHPSPAGYALLGERFARSVFGPGGYFGAGQ
jgi:lysophospholipase L1-like esterase